MKHCEKETPRALRVAFAHLDLGIGGAEQLVVNAALALQECGHSVTIFTTHHSPDHCFAPTHGKGKLARAVVVVGDWLPRSLGGRAVALCSSVRMVYLAVYMVLRWRVEDVVFCDGVSTHLPVLRSRFNVLFYCHFPDKLLCTARDSWLKRLYRWPLDWLEEFTMSWANSIVVNSEFTRGVFKDAFPALGRFVEPAIVYPAADLDSFTPPNWRAKSAAKSGFFVSLNRFERKKNVGLAIEALAVLRSMADASEVDGVHLVIAGGYDERVRENVEYLRELEMLADQCGVRELVSFRPSISDEERDSLLQSALCVIYTPENEHFGIVPVEAMYAGAPVLATDTGGPLETVLDNKTGFLRGSSPDSFGEAMLYLLKRPELSVSMGRMAHDHVKSKFGKLAFRTSVEASIRQARDRSARPPLLREAILLALFAILLTASAMCISAKAE